jgi:hypothetical protein
MNTTDSRSVERAEGAASLVTLVTRIAWLSPALVLALVRLSSAGADDAGSSLLISKLAKFRKREEQRYLPRRERLDG